MTPATPARNSVTELEHSPAQPAFLRLPRNAAVLVVIWAVSVMGTLTASHFGRFAIATMSGDWAQQMYLVETDSHNAGLPSNSAARLADEGFGGGIGANYPHLHALMMGYTAYWLDLNPLRSMQV